MPNSVSDTLLETVNRSNGEQIEIIYVSRVSARSQSQSLRHKAIDNGVAWNLRLGLN